MITLVISMVDKKYVSDMFGWLLKLRVFEILILACKPDNMSTVFSNPYNNSSGCLPYMPVRYLCTTDVSLIIYIFETFNVTCTCGMCAKLQFYLPHMHSSI